MYSKCKIFGNAPMLRTGKSEESLWAVVMWGENYGKVKVL